MGNNKDDFKFYSNDLLQKLGVEGTKQGFFVNIKQRKVISEKGLKYKNKMYYTLDELPDGFYNVEYEDKNTESPQIGNIETMSLDANSWKFIVSDIKYGGYVNKGQVFYKKDGAENWEKTENDYFVVSEPGKYDVKVVDVAGNESEIQKKETNPADSPECWEKIYNPEPSQWYSYGNSNVNEPKLKGNMTPIRYIGVVAEGANTTNNWANAITADGSMWVWIPRYAYKITYYTDSNYTTTTTNKTQYGKIDVAFVKYENGQNMFLNSTDSGEITSDPTEVGAGTEKWLIHPAFINDSSNNFANGGWDRELSGIWVGKFETTGAKTTDSEGNVTKVTISVLPGKSALTQMKIKDEYKYAKLATFGENISAQTLGSHMAKNSEWGVIVYLAYSKYGTNGKDVKNNGFDSTGGTTTQKSIYHSQYEQSTTNNPYGVYDLRGGSWEYVASYVNYGSSSSDLTNGGTTSGDLYGSGDEQSTSTKYKTVYTASGFAACGTLFNSVFGLNYQKSMIVCAIVIVLYTSMGGFLAASTTDLIQGLLMSFAIVIVLIVGVVNAGGVANVIAHGQAMEGFFDVMKYHDPATGGAVSQGVIPILSGLAWGLGYCGMPHILTRFMAVKLSLIHI